MTLLGLILVLASLFEVGSSQEQIHRFYRSGQDVTLPCGSQPTHGPQCSDITWLYNGNPPATKTEVRNGKVEQKSQRAARLRVNTDCSLVITSTADRDVGRYTCRPNDANHLVDVHVYLSRLKISLFSADQTRDDEVMLECSLLRFDGLPECRQNPLRWVDDTGTELSEDVVNVHRGADCFYRLTVKRQSNRRYTCQYVNEENRVEIEANYTPVPPDPDPGPVPTTVTAPDPTSDPRPGPKSGAGFNLDQIYIIVGALLGVLLLLVVMTTVLIKYRKRTNVTEDVQKPTQSPDEPDSDVIYITVSHKQQEASKKKAEKEEEVTYSAIRSAVKMGRDDDPSGLYSNVSKPGR